MKQFRNIAKFALAAVFAAGAFVHVDAKGVAQGSDEDIRIVKVDDSNFEKEILQSKRQLSQILRQLDKQHAFFTC